MTRRPGPALLTTVLLTALVAGACERAIVSTTPGPGSTSGPTSRPSSTAPASSVPIQSPVVTGSPPQLDRLAITLEAFATVPERPLAIAAPDDGSGRLFVAGQDGRVWVVERKGTVRSTPMVDLRSRIETGGERGLLGIATHPTFPADPRVFVNYTNKDGDTIVASLRLDPNDANRLDPESHRQLLFVDQPFPNHNGGGVLFGPDGDLYLSLGDGGGGGDALGNGQSRETLLGKILRIDVDSDSGGAGYAIPAGNPFANGGGLLEIWHWGLRNPWRLSFDRATGDLWIGDVGQNAWEEVDVAPQGVGGLNFGWNLMEGSHCYQVEKCATDGLTLPASDYGRDMGCTVIGGYVYRGSRYPFLVGTYLFADYCSGRIFAIDAAGAGVVAPVVVGNGGSGISAFGEDVDGELYVTNLDGNVSHVVAAQR